MNLLIVMQIAGAVKITRGIVSRPMCTVRQQQITRNAPCALAPTFIMRSRSGGYGGRGIYNVGSGVVDTDAQVTDAVVPDDVTVPREPRHAIL